MIQDSIGYGEGYEKATEPGPDVEILYYVNNEELIWEWRPRKKDDINVPLHNDCHYRKPIKPKEEKMEEQLEPNVEITTKAGKVVLSLDDAIKIGEDAKKKKTEIAKREEIQVGDWCQTGSKLFKCSEIKGNYAQSKNKDSYYLGCCKKLHPTPEVKAWLDGVVGGLVEFPLPSFYLKKNSMPLRNVPPMQAAKLWPY